MASPNANMVSPTFLPGNVGTTFVALGMSCARSLAVSLAPDPVTIEIILCVSASMTAYAYCSLTVDSLNASI